MKPTPQSNSTHGATPTPRERPTATGAASGATTENAVRRARRQRREAPPRAFSEGEASWPAPSQLVRSGNAYYFPDGTLAFVEHRRKLVAKTNNAEVVRTLVDIAQSRGWDAITVSGAPAFRQAVWQAASARGIEVHGHVATELDLAGLTRAAKPAPDGSHARPTASPVPTPSSRHTPARGATSRVAGRLLAHGAAHYKFEPNRRLSYFVKLRTADGERTLWGVDLERALAESESRIQVGDAVLIEGRGSEPVKVKVPQRDDRGTWIPDRIVETKRNRWVVESPSWFEQREAGAAALREGRLPDAGSAGGHRGIASSIAALWLGQRFAARQVERADDRHRLVVALRQRLAELLERGDTVPMPMVKVRSRTGDRTDGTATHEHRGARARAVVDREVPPFARG